MFLRFAFGGEAYQNRALPFGLALFPCMFTKCMNAALALLRLQGIHAFNYIDDWLMLAQLEELAAQHQELVLTFRAQAEPQEECVFPHFSRYSVGFDHNAGTFVSCKCRIDPKCYETYQAQSGASSFTSSETVSSHGGSSQCHSSRLSAHEAIPVLAQKQRIPSSKSSLQGCKKGSTVPSGSPSHLTSHANWSCKGNSEF